MLWQLSTFWGGSISHDTFSFSTITGSSSGTAYFWNEAGTDSIVLGNVVSSAGGPGVNFGVTSGSSLNISFVTNQTSAQFGTGISNAFDVHNTLVSFGVGASNYITLAFVGDGVVTLQGFSEAEANAITNSFGATAGGGTANFGTALAIPTFS